MLAFLLPTPCCACVRLSLSPSASQRSVSKLANRAWPCRLQQRLPACCVEASWPPSRLPTFSSSKAACMMPRACMLLTRSALPCTSTRPDEDSTCCSLRAGPIGPMCGPKSSCMWRDESVAADARSMHMEAETSGEHCCSSWDRASTGSRACSELACCNLLCSL